MGEGVREKGSGVGDAIGLQGHHHLGTLSETKHHCIPVQVRLEGKQWPFHSICSQHTCFYTAPGPPSACIQCPTILAVILVPARFSI